MWSCFSLLFLCLNICNVESVRPDNLQSLEPIKINIVRSNNIFETFLKQLIDLLTSRDFKGKKLKKYCKILSEELRYSEYRVSRKLGRHIKYLCRKYEDELIGELDFYRQELDKTTKLRADFLSAINEAFTLQQRIRFTDYLYDLKDFGTDDKLTIHEETKELIDQVIVGSILKLNSKTQNDIAWKLKKAVKEFNSRK